VLRNCYRGIGALLISPEDALLLLQPTAHITTMRMPDNSWRSGMLKRMFTIKRTLIGAYLVLGTFLLAHTVNALVAEALHFPDVHISVPTTSTASEHVAASPRELADGILAKALFPLPAAALTSGQANQAPAPPLNVAQKVMLLGTVFRQQGGIMAILEELPTKNQRMYHLGEQVPAVGALAAIERDRVLFREGKQEEWLDLALTQQARSRASDAATQAAVSRPSGPQRRVLDRREVDAAISDTTRLLTQAQAIPYLTDGKLDGMRLASVTPLGFFDKIGLQTNDILQRINGVALRDPGMLLSLFQQLRNERTIRVDLVRNAERQTLTYEIR